MFDLFKKEVHYSAEQVHAEMFLMISAYLKQLEDFKETRLCKPEVFTMQRKLRNIGLTNSKNSLILQNNIDSIRYHNENVEYYQNTFRLIQCLLGFFGPNVMLIKFDDFEKIINKYNLVCGNMYQYVGTIPEKNIEEIYNAQQKLNLIYNFSDSKFEYTDYSNEQKQMIKFLQNELKPLLKINGLHSRYKKYKKEIYRFPFMTKDLYIPAINERTAPGLVDLSNDITTMFIVAPANEMKFTDLKFTNKIKTEDPFVCAYSKYGIVIFSKWGTESEDEIIKKYENLII